MTGRKRRTQEAEEGETNEEAAGIDTSTSTSDCIRTISIHILMQTKKKKKQQRQKGNWTAVVCTAVAEMMEGTGLGDWCHKMDRIRSVRRTHKAARL